MCTTDISNIYALFKQSTGVSIDTRTIQKGNLFFALKGPSFDGNKYAKAAIDKGAVFAVIDDPKYQSEQTIVVSNVLDTLQRLALHHRKQLDIPVIALTGSNGKTTTKELMRAVLETVYHVFATKGNLNNHIGIPLSLLSVTSAHEIAIIEMGANHEKEIAGYCEYVCPTHGLITNIGTAHLEGFGSLEGIVRGKTELYQYICKTKGILFYRYEDALLEEKSRSAQNRISYGESDRADIVAKIKMTTPTICLTYKGRDIESSLPGAYNFHNILTAVAVGQYFGIPAENIKRGIEGYVPDNNRSQIIQKNGNLILLDAYNANPSSVKLSLQMLDQINDQPKIVFLGDMYELGKQSLEEHRAIVDQAKSLHLEQIVCVGEQFQQAAGGDPNIKTFNSTLEAKEWFKKQSFSGKTILIKGSRSMQMETILE